jgi:prepilin-type N-terminal cleavage/methylation domain-containing protein
VGGRSARRAKDYLYPAAPESFSRRRSTVINHQSSFIYRKGFTLIELLVVIAIIALLMAILMPTLSRVRKQARAVTCRANLGQWGILYATYAAENDGHLPGWRDRSSNPGDPGWGWWGWGWGGERAVQSGKCHRSVEDRGAGAGAAGG